MQAEDVVKILADVQQHGFACWISGGWGVDALVGEQTRPHQDLDLAADATQLKAILAHLGGQGYRVTVDWLPVRAEMTSPDGLKVDFHPVVFDADGNGRQEGLEGTYFIYPADQFVKGTISGVPVPCIGKELQIIFHQGYLPREIDVLDLEQLARFSTEQPTP